MKIRPINGMGEGRPVRKCEWCSADAQGRPTHLVLGPDGSGDWRWVCDDCFRDWQRPDRVEAIEPIAIEGREVFIDPDRGFYHFLGAGREHKGAFPGVWGEIHTEPEVVMPMRWNAETETFE